MSRYPGEDVARFDRQFAESPDERNERQRARRQRLALETHWKLIADLSAFLADEGYEVFDPDLLDLRRRRADGISSLFSLI